MRRQIQDIEQFNQGNLAELHRPRLNQSKAAFERGAEKAGVNQVKKTTDRSGT